jgi:ligand-binding sensor domain-containing protein
VIPASATVDFEAPAGQLVTIGNKTYSAAGDRLTIYDWDTKTDRVIETKAPVVTVAVHAEKVYVGGDKLYVLEDTILVEVDSEIEGSISSLLSFKYRLLVGTDHGLYSRSVFGDEHLLPDVAVSALASDDLGVWIGTDGDGLFRWNGVDFRARYLARDESLLAEVTALDFGKNHLYVGTPNGLFIYDGGKWQELSSADGLPGDAITAIDASYWVVAIGTDQGVATYFKNEFETVKQLESTVASALARVDKQLLVQTSDGGLLIKSGPTVRPLITPNPLEKTDIFSGLSE